MEEPHYRTPGEALAALLDRYNQPPEALAEALRVPRSVVLQLLGNHIAISAETALRLGRATNTPPEYWLEMQNTADLNIARGRIGPSLSRIQSLVAAPPPGQTAKARVFASQTNRLSNVDHLLQLASGWAADHRDYFQSHQSGSSGLFQRILRDLAEIHIGRRETRPLEILGGRGLIDYYFPEERTAVDIVLDLGDSPDAFFQAALRSLIASDEGAVIERLILVSRPGAAWTISERKPAWVGKWLKERHGIAVEIRELGTRA